MTLPHPDVLVDAIDTVSAACGSPLGSGRVYFISSMGGANKIHPELLKAPCSPKLHGDFWRVHYAQEFASAWPERFSRGACPKPAQEVLAPKDAEGKAAQFGTASYIPPIMEQLIAGATSSLINGPEPKRGESCTTPNPSKQHRACSRHCRTWLLTLMCTWILCLPQVRWRERLVS